MTLHKLRFIYKYQSGFTLIEMLMVVTLVGLMSLGVTAAIRQLLIINSRSSNHMIAVRQVQQVGKEVSKDALQAQILTLGENSGFPLTLTWDEWGTNVTHEVIYSLGDMPSGELKKLQRSYTIGGEAQGTAPHFVAEYIDDTIDPVTGEPKTNCDWDDVNEILIFTVTATVGGQSETRVYEIEPRPD